MPTLVEPWHAPLIRPRIRSQKEIDIMETVRELGIYGQFKQKRNA